MFPFTIQPCSHGMGLIWQKTIRKYKCISSCSVPNPSSMYLSQPLSPTPTPLPVYLYGTWSNILSISHLHSLQLVKSTHLSPLPAGFCTRSTNKRDEKLSPPPTQKLISVYGSQPYNSVNQFTAGITVRKNRGLQIKKQNCWHNVVRGVLVGTSPFLPFAMLYAADVQNPPEKYLQFYHNWLKFLQMFWQTASPFKKGACEHHLMPAHMLLCTENLNESDTRGGRVLCLRSWRTIVDQRVWLHYWNKSGDGSGFLKLV